MTKLSFRKVDCFVPFCVTCRSDLLGPEGFVPHFTNPWGGTDDPADEDPTEDDLHCPVCQPIPYELAPNPTEVIRIAPDPARHADSGLFPGSKGLVEAASALGARLKALMDRQQHVGNDQGWISGPCGDGEGEQK